MGFWGNEQNRLVGMLVEKDQRIDQLEQTLIDHGIDLPDPADKTWVVPCFERRRQEQEARNHLSH